MVASSCRRSGVRSRSLPLKLYRQHHREPAPSRHPVEFLRKCSAECVLVDLMAAAGRSDRTKFRNQVLKPLTAEGLVEMTYPDKPRSSKQKCRLTAKGSGQLGSGEAR